MPDYKKSVIYKIYDNTNGDTYYGSTCNELRFRIWKHKSSAKCNSDGAVSKSIFLNDDYDYSVVEEFPCENRQELHTRERWWIENNVCINKSIPTRTQKEYYIVNRERIITTAKEHYDKNKDTIKLNNKKYRANNMEEISKKRAIKIECECGCKITSRNISAHRTSARHINLMSCLSCPPSSPQP